MKKLHILSAALAVAAAFTLTACGNGPAAAAVPSAGELFGNAPTGDDLDLSVDIGYTVTYPADAEPMMEDTSGNDADADYFSSAYTIAYDIKAGADIAHATGTETYSYSAADVEPDTIVQSTDIWTAKDGDAYTAYLSDTVSGEWYKQSTDGDGVEAGIRDTFAELTKGELLEQSVEEQDNTWLAKGTSTLSATPIADMVASAVFLEESDAPVEITAVFDKETKRMLSLAIHAETDIDLGDETEPYLCRFLCDIDIKINGTDPMELSLPEEVSENAVDLDAMYENAPDVAGEDLMEDLGLTDKTESSVSGNGPAEEETDNNASGTEAGPDTETTPDEEAKTR